MSAESASATQKTLADLLDFVDWSGVECLNQSTSHSLANALKQFDVAKGKALVMATLASRGIGLGLETVQEGWGHFKVKVMWVVILSKGKALSALMRNRSLMGWLHQLQGYREDEGLNLESDADEQLLIYIPFTQVIKLHSIAINGPEDEGFAFLKIIDGGRMMHRTIITFSAMESPRDTEWLRFLSLLQRIKFDSSEIAAECGGPKTVKLYANREHMGFSNVNDFPPSDTAVLSPEILQGKPVVLKYVKFQNVRSLTIFVEDNQSGSDVTKIQKIVLYGTTVETTDMKGLKKIEDH
ncbi:hypothetical protein RHSIM_Rhsim10G0108600 [Rhododendron simsii]|uniref:PITH domain-containing protein n=1 Tax=Rhododendron simsii TaxID=118357 RepID=A0A834GA54_RHOSS|nr:hypothetical protein RHSIM_Rhsim10G0108600 [Rhododendron simsii]